MGGLIEPLNTDTAGPVGDDEHLGARLRHAMNAGHPGAGQVTQLIGGRGNLLGGSRWRSVVVRQCNRVDEDKCDICVIGDLPYPWRATGADLGRSRLQNADGNVHLRPSRRVHSALGENPASASAAAAAKR